jgi:hypothetical protein
MGDSLIRHELDGLPLSWAEAEKEALHIALGDPHPVIEDGRGDIVHLGRDAHELGEGVGVAAGLQDGADVREGLKGKHLGRRRARVVSCNVSHDDYDMSGRCLTGVMCLGGS